MAYEAGDLKVFNPNKEISKEITLDVLIRHRDALKQARTGVLKHFEKEKVRELKDNERTMNQIKALNLILSAQREMITISRPIIWYRSTQKWKKKTKEEDREKYPFKDFDCDYKTIINWLEFLRKCADAIKIAERTKTLTDDFVLKKQTEMGDVMQLTDNFFEMVEDLESSYEQIYLLMLINKIVSAGIEEDEEATYKEKEAEAVRKVQEA